MKNLHFHYLREVVKWMDKAYFFENYEKIINNHSRNPNET